MNEPDSQRRAIREQIQQAADAADGPALVQAVRRLAALKALPADAAFAVRRLTQLPADEVTRAGLKPQRVWVARSVTVEPVLPHLALHGACGGLWLQFEVGGYGSFADDMMNPEGALARAKPDLVLLVVDLEDIAGDLRDACAGGSATDIAAATEAAESTLRGLITALRGHSTARLLVQGLVLPDRPVLGDVADGNLEQGEGSAVSRINRAMARACREVGDAVFLDLDRVAARFGRARWRDERMFRINRLALCSELFDDFGAAVVRALRPLYFPARKVLCTDLDHTLWGGIVGEDGPDGIATSNTYPGNCYQDYQRLLRQLSRRGVLLAIASKNNPDDVKEAFERRKRDLLLGLDDFVAVQIGWQSKVVSIRTMARALSLGVDSFVFVDDSEVECAEVRQELPEVLVLQAPAREPWKLTRELAALGAFDQLTVTDADRERVQDYKAQSQRAALEEEAGSRDAFLASLGIVCTAVSALAAPLSRTAQLLGKTNQFNLTTRRHSAGDVERLAAEPGAQALALRVRDRFGDAGVVGVALARTQGQRCIIDSFLLSCRVIGRGVESALLWHLGRKAAEHGARLLVGEFIPTRKNKPCAELYVQHGFCEAGPSPDGGTFFELDLSRGPPPCPAWITFEDE